MDYFDTEEFQSTKATSAVEVPAFQETEVTNLTRKKQYRHIQNPKFLKLNTAPPAVESDLSKYFSRLETQTSTQDLNFFSTKYRREKIVSLLLQTNQFEKQQLQEAKLKANPYSLVHECTKFQHPGAVVMANLHNLYKELFRQNYMIDTYYFLTIGEKGGVSEYTTQVQQQEALVGLQGWAVFPSAEFEVDNVTSLKEIHNFEKLEELADQIYCEMGDASAMLIVCDLGTEKTNFTQKEKKAKTNICSSLYLASKLMAKGGNLVIKTSNTWEPSTIELLYLVATNFEQFSVVKPFSASPHSFSRFIVGLDFKAEMAEETFKDLCKALESHLENNQDLSHIYDFSKVTKDHLFQNFMREHNDVIAETQIEGLQTVLSILQGSEVSINKKEVADRCLMHWGLKEMEHKQETPTKLPAKRVSRPFENSVRHEKIPDLSGVSHIINRNPKTAPKTQTELPSLARKKPEEITKLRTIDLQSSIQGSTERSKEELMKKFERQIKKQGKKKK